MTRPPTVERLDRRVLLSGTFYVSPDGSDTADGATPGTAWRHVQHAVDAAPPGSTVRVLAGRYREHLTISTPGGGGRTTFQAVGHAILDGGGSGGPVITLTTASDVTIAGFDLTDYATDDGGAAFLFRGSGDGVRLLNNHVHHTRGRGASAIGVYGTDPAVPIGHLVIDGNTVDDCQPAHSETVTLNGNVTGFAVTNNVVRDTNNIGIDVIGGEGTSPDPATDAARGGTVAGNHVTRARSSYGGGYGAGIYVDGGRDIVVERNTVDHCDLGIEVGCEHAGRTASGVVVRDNLLADNAHAGLAFGGYAAKVGRVVDCQFVNNTLVHNQARPDGSGELWVQLADRCTVANNLIVAGRQGIATSADADGGVTGTGNAFDHNLYFGTARGGRLSFGWQGQTFDTAAAYRAATGQDGHSVFADPKLADLKGLDVHLSPGSPAVGAGDPGAAAGPLDLFGRPRTAGGKVDVGAAQGG